MKFKIKICLFIIFFSLIFFIPSNVFADAQGEYEGLIYNIDSKTNEIEINDADNDVTKVIIPKTINGKKVTSIGKGAFSGCTNLTDITIPNSVTNIESRAFEKCTKLENITIPNSVKKIGTYSFLDCESLTNINIPNGILSIENGTFMSCNKLTEIKIPSSVTSIGDYAFWWCEDLKDIEIPNSVKTIGNLAFGECDGLTDINIPNNVVDIGDGAFSRCSNLTRVKISDNVEEIKLETFSTCTKLKKVELGKGVTKIGDSAFYYCTSLTDINIHDNVRIIGSHVFENCTDLQDIVLGNNVEIIGDYVFGECTNLNKITIPNSVGSIGENAFAFLRGGGYQTAPVGLVFRIEKNSYADKYVEKYSLAHEYVTNVLFLNITNISEQVYTGKTITQNVIIMDANKVLTNGIDYKISYNNNVNVGNATITIIGMGDYIGTITKTFKINKATYDMNKVKFNNLTVTYDGKSHWITATGLPSGVTVKYTNNGKKAVGTYTVTAMFTGDSKNYNTIANKTATLKINAKKISKFKVNSILNQTYTGKYIKPGITVKDGSITLKNGIDYTVTYKNNKNLGKATAVVTGKGNYTGTLTKTFIIKPAKVNKLKVSKVSNNAVKISWSKATGVTGYKVYQYNYSKKKWEYVGKTTSTKYTIKKLKAGTICKFRVRGYKTINKVQYFGKYSSSLKTSTAPITTKITKISTKSKKVTLKWKKISGVSGYQIYMSTSKNGKYKKIKTITKSGTVKYTKGGLKKGKKYYFKIKAYKSVDKDKVYSSYCKVKNIKVK